MYQLYIGNKNYSSWSLRPWVLMREHGIEVEEHLVPFGGGSNWEKYRAFSPSGKVPCLIDGDPSEGEITVWDSLAIAEYLAERHPGLWPENARARAWARCAAAEMHSGFAALRNQCPMSCGVRVRLHQITPELHSDIERIAELWHEGVSRYGGPLLAGDTFTVVDAMYAPVVFRVLTYGLDVGDAGAAYVSMMAQRDSMQAWRAAALLEPWREVEHEKELKATGTVLEDGRVPAST
jgi:glutathione S-transferase